MGGVTRNVKRSAPWRGGAWGSQGCVRKAGWKNIMKCQEALKDTATNLDLNHMLLIYLYAFLMLLLPLSSEKSFTGSQSDI